MGSFYTTGAVFFLWPALILTLIFEYVWCVLSILLAFRTGNPRGTALPALKKHLFPVFVTSFGCNAALTAVIFALYVLSEINPGLSAALNAPFSGLGGTLTALLVIALVLLTGTLKSILYRRIVFRRTVSGEETGRKTIRILTILTTPWLYLLPTQTAYALLGSVMMAIGRLAPGELPAELPTE